MIEVNSIKSVSARSIAVMLSCFCTFLFQTSNAAMSHHFTSVETVINNNISQAKNNSNKNYTSPTNFKAYQSKVSNPPKYNHVLFTTCNNCYWCASCITDDPRFDWCPSCRETKVRSIPISTGGTCKEWI